MIPKGMDRETRRLVRKALDAGWTLKHRKRTAHVQLLAPDGSGIVTVASTPSDHRGLKNTRADLRRHGLEI